jgi:radical SAM protein with 4Fe4S-binding SPASM domain
MVKRGARLVLKTVLMPDNFHDRGNVKALAEKLGCHLTESWEVVPRFADRLLPASGKLSAAESVAAMCARSEKPEFFLRSEKETHFCNAGGNLWALDPPANVFPCPILRLPCGNLLRDPWTRIYNHPLMRRLRAVSAGPSGCRGCRLQPYCRRCPGEAWLEEGYWNRPYASACQWAAAWHRRLRGKFALSRQQERKPAWWPEDAGDEELRRAGFTSAQIRRRRARKRTGPPAQPRDAEASAPCVTCPEL